MKYCEQINYKTATYQASYCNNNVMIESKNINGFEIFK
jgi:hypothetical protein